VKAEKAIGANAENDAQNQAKSHATQTIALGLVIGAGCFLRSCGDNAKVVSTLLQIVYGVVVALWGVFDQGNHVDSYQLDL
jgi:hypothetical protein